MYSEFFRELLSAGGAWDILFAKGYPRERRVKGLFLECSRAHEVRFDLEGIPSRAARQKDAKRIMKRKERKEDGVKFLRRARVWVWLENPCWRRNGR